MYKPSYQLLQTTRPQREVEIPDWLKRYANDWKGYGAKSIILFGSRSNGYYLPDSDWDVAVVHDNDADLESVGYFLPKRPFAEEVNPIHWTINDIRESYRKQPSIGGEIAQGMLIGGCDLDLTDIKVTPDREDLGRHLRASFISVVETLTRTNTFWLQSDKPDLLSAIRFDYSESGSAQAAERMTKAVCCLFDIRYARVHNVFDLASEVVEPYRSMILNMNGQTGRLHTATYRRRRLETCNDSLIRVERTLALCKELLTRGELCLTTEEVDTITKAFEGEAQLLNLMPTEEIHPDVLRVKRAADELISNLDRYLMRDGEVE